MIVLRNSELFDTVATLSGGDPYILSNVSVHGKRLQPAPFNPLQDNYLNDLLAHAEARGAEFILCVYTALFRHGRAVPGYRVG